PIPEEIEVIVCVYNSRTEAIQQRDVLNTLSCNVAAIAQEIKGSHLLVATGHLANTDDFRLDKAGVTTNKDGSIKVNARLETSVPGIWALGDCKGGPAFTHISYNDFQIVYANVVEAKNLNTENRM